MLERLRRLVAPRPLETTYDDAPAAFADYHEEGLREAREEAERIRTDIATAVVELESGLEALETFEDERDRVADVVSHVGTKRRSHLDTLSLSDDPTALREAVETFLQDRSDLSRKERAILRQIELPPEYQEAMEEFKTTVERLERFLENEYERLESLETLENLVDDRREQLERIEAIEADIAELDPASIEEELATKRAELQDLEESEHRMEYDDLEQTLEVLERERDEIVSDITSGAAQCRRGLRKLIYAVENEDVTIDTDLAVLKELRDGQIDALLDRDPDHVRAVLETAAAELTGAHLDDAERRRLRDGLEDLQQFPDQAERIEQVDAKRTRLEQRLQTHEFHHRRQELTDTIDRLEAELGDVRAERDRLEHQLSEARTALSNIEDRIEDVLVDQIPGSVTIESSPNSW